MRVAIVTESFLPSANGVTTSVLRVLDHLAAHGHHAQVICPGPAPDEYAGFAVREVGSLTYRGFPIGVPSAHLTQALLDDRPDVLHTASPFVLADLTLAPSTAALADLRRHRVPRVEIWGRGVDTTGFHPATAPPRREPLCGSDSRRAASC